MGANYVGRELGYGAAAEWGPFDVATNAAFEPIETFGARFDALLTAVVAAGFEALDLWLAHLNWRWATPEHVAIARDLLDRHGLRVVSLAGNFGATPAELASACALANALDVDLLGGMGDVLSNDRAGAESVLRDHGVRFGYENHPEKSPAGGPRADRRCRGRARSDRRHRLVGDAGLRPGAGDPRSPRAALPRPPEGRRGAGNPHLVHARRGHRPHRRLRRRAPRLGLSRPADRSSTSRTTGIRRRR